MFNKQYCIRYIALISACTLILCGCSKKYEPLGKNENVTKKRTKLYLKEKTYPKELTELLERNPETADFVLGYHEEIGKTHTIDLSEYENSTEVPLLLQWDKRWGYEPYGGSMMAISGCGPVCLSMVLVYLLNDPTLHPLEIAEFSMKNGHCVNGGGTAWSLMTQGAESFGLKSKEVPLDENRIKSELINKNPIIASMGPGDFTTEGHFIVLCGYENGMIKVNDPNSKIRSERYWKYEDICGQIKNLWVYTK